jgi:hypothetical protein
MVPPYTIVKEIGNIARTNGERPRWTTYVGIFEQSVIHKRHDL